MDGSDFIKNLIEERNYAADRGNIYAQGVVHYSDLAGQYVDEINVLKQKILDIEKERHLQSLNPEVLAQLMQHARETSKIEELRSWDKRLSKIDIPIYTTNETTPMSNPSITTHTSTTSTNETTDISTLTATTVLDTQSDNSMTVKPRRIRKPTK